jgi:hypothetical protein
LLFVIIFAASLYHRVAESYNPSSIISFFDRPAANCWLPTDLTRRVKSTEFLHHCVVEQWSEVLDLFVIPTGMNTIGEENYRHLSLQVKPKRGTRETEMANRFCREMVSSAGIREVWGVKP